MAKRVDNFSEASFIYGKHLSGLGGPTIFANHIVLSYEVSSGTAGYTTASATWTAVKLNTLTAPARDQTSYVILSSTGNGTFELVPGIYCIRGVFTLGGTNTGNVGKAKIRLMDLSMSSVLSHGQNFYGDGEASNTHAHFNDIVRVLRPTRMRFETFVSGASGSLAQYAASITSTPEVYNAVHIYRIGNSGGTRGL
jgi:hypothetical protein